MYFTDTISITYHNKTVTTQIGEIKVANGKHLENEGIRLQI